MAKISSEIQNASTVLEQFAMKSCGKPVEIVGTQEKKVFFGLLGTKQVPIGKTYWNVETDNFTMISRSGAEQIQMAVLTFTHPLSVRLQISISANQYKLSILQAKPVTQELQKLVEEGLIGADEAIPTSVAMDKFTAINNEELWYVLNNLLQTGIISIGERYLYLQRLAEFAN